MLYYVYISFTWTLPWASCNATWATGACLDTLDFVNTSTPVSTSQFTSSNYTVVQNETVKRVSAAEEFFHNHVLEMSSGIVEIGGIKPHLVICELTGWLIVYLCLLRGVRSMGKVIYVTATLPYVFILVFIVRAALLPGSMDGVMYYITPDFSRLRDGQIWLAAFIQVFYSLGLSWGGIVTMASYNKPNHPLQKEAIAVPIVSSCTSFLCGFLVFSVSGFLAHVTGRSVPEAVSSGPGLAFITYPEAAAHFPGAPVWCALFFLMLIMTGIDSQFVTLETTISGINDDLKIKPKFQPLIVTITTVICALLSLPLATGAGMYIFQVLDWYIALICFLFGFIECIALIWFYGHRRLFKDISSIIGRIAKPFRYFLTAHVGVVIPVLLLVSLGVSLTTLVPPTYGEYEYPGWIHYIGVSMSLGLGLPVPLVAVYKLVTVEGDTWREKVRKAIFGGVDRQHEEVETDQFI